MLEQQKKKNLLQNARRKPFSNHLAFFHFLIGSTLVLEQKLSQNYLNCSFNCLLSKTSITYLGEKFVGFY